MPVAVALVGAYVAGSAAAGAIAAGTLGTLGTIAAYATVAGSVMTAAGALTGSKDLTRVGAAIGLAGGLTSLGSSLSEGAAAGAENAAQGATENSMGNSLGGAASGAPGVPAGAEGAAGPLASATGAVSSPVTSGAVQSTDLLDQAQQSVADGTADLQPGGAMSAAQNSTATPMPNAQATPDQTPNGVDPNAPPDSTDAGSVLAAGKGALTPSPTSAPVATPTPGAGGPLANRVTATGMDANMMQSLLARARSMGSDVQTFIQHNPTLTNLVGKGLEGAYGLPAQKFDFEKGLIEQARSNLNSPVKLGAKGP